MIQKRAGNYPFSVRITEHLVSGSDCALICDFRVFPSEFSFFPERKKKIFQIKSRYSMNNTPRFLFDHMFCHSKRKENGDSGCMVYDKCIVKKHLR